MAELINALGANGLDFKELTVIGHGLGAFMIGRAAKIIKSAYRIGCIIALDIASMGFHHMDGKGRLTASDADYVEVHHTDITTFGMGPEFGHGDYHQFCAQFDFQLNDCSEISL